MNPEGPRHRDCCNWFIPLIFYIIAMSSAAVYGGNAARLKLPTAWFAQTSHWWLVVFVIISFVIPLRRLARAVWLMGLGCMMYAPLLLHAGTSQILLTRSLTPQESADFEDRFREPFLLSYGGRKMGSLRMRRGDFTEEMRSHLEGIGALSARGSE